MQKEGRYGSAGKETERIEQRIYKQNPVDTEGYRSAMMVAYRSIVRRGCP